MSLLDDAYQSEPEHFIAVMEHALGREIANAEVALKHNPDLLLNSIEKWRQFKSDVVDIVDALEEIAEEYEAQEEERYYHEMAP